MNTQNPWQSFIHNKKLSKFPLYIAFMKKNPAKFFFKWLSIHQNKLRTIQFL